MNFEVYPLGAPGLHALLNDFGINFRFDHTYTFNCLGINIKSVIGALWDYTCTPEIALTLLNWNEFLKYYIYTYTFISFQITNVI